MSRWREASRTGLRLLSVLAVVAAILLPAHPAAAQAVPIESLAGDRGVVALPLADGGPAPDLVFGAAVPAPGGQAIVSPSPGSRSAPFDAIRRWLELCLFAGLIGGLGVGVVVLRPIAAGDPVRTVAEAARPRVLALAAGAGLLACLLGLADLAAHPSPAGPLFAGTGWGAWWLLREVAVAGLTVIAAALRAGGGVPSRGGSAVHADIAVLSIVAVTADSLAAAGMRGVAVTAMAARSLAAFVWLGGVAALIVVWAGAPADRPAVRRLVRDRFSPLAGGAAGLVVVTGAVPLLMAGGLGGSVPSRPVPVPAGTAVSRSGTVADLTISIRVSPGRPGPNGVTVFAGSSRRPPPAPITTVWLELAGETRAVALREVEPGRYTGVIDLAAPGTARATVAVRRGATRLTLPFAWPVTAAPEARPATGRGALAAPGDVAALVVAGVLGLAAWWWARRRPVPHGPPAGAVRTRILEDVR